MADRRETLVVVSIDTEEDNWDRSRNGVGVDNLRQMPRLARFFERLGIRPTYFTSYQVAIALRAADMVRDACANGAGEIGAHLHPWNTPPLVEAFVPRNSMTKNLPVDVQRAKIARLTAALAHAFGERPRAFRAGRYGLGPDTVRVLADAGYGVDSSVSPYTDLRSTDDGPNFVGAPLDVYRLGLNGDVRRPDPAGRLAEVPLSCGYSRTPFAFWDPVRRLLEREPLRRLRLAGLAARTGVVQRLTLCPELATEAEMLTLSRRLLEQGARHLHVSWHSPTLTPGLSPFAATASDVARLFYCVEAYLDGLASLTSVRFVTVSEAADLLLSR